MTTTDKMTLDQASMELAKTKNELERLALLEKELKDRLMHLMQSTGKLTAKYEFGTVVRKQMERWEYLPEIAMEINGIDIEVNTLNARKKKIKEEAQVNGQAKPEKFETIAFTPAKK